MTPATFKKRLNTLGFEQSKNSLGIWRFHRDVNGTAQYVERNSVRGSAWRLHLAVGAVPEIWPATNVHVPQTWHQAESPWFEYFADDDTADPLPPELDTREVALQKCFDWFSSVGVEWLREPGGLRDDEWREIHNIIVQH